MSRNVTGIILVFWSEYMHRNIEENRRNIENCRHAKSSRRAPGVEEGMELGRQVLPVRRANVLSRHGTIDQGGVDIFMSGQSLYLL